MLRALLIALVAAAVYFTTAALGGNFGKHGMVYFDHLAESFLRGRLYLEAPPAVLDLTQHAGRWYVPFPPVPALLMLPIVAVLGPMAPFEVPLSAALGGLNVALVYLALAAMRERKWTSLDEAGCLCLAALFGFGTVHWYAAAEGTVWYLSQVVTVGFLTLAVLTAVRRSRPAWTGVALALAVGARPNVALALPFFIAELALRDREDGVADRRWPSRAVILTLPVAGAFLALLAYNAARFGSPLDFGYASQNVDPRLAADLRAHGLFSLHFLGRNAALAFAGLPEFHARFPLFTPRPEGTSLLLVTPALFYLFPHLFRHLLRRPPLGAARFSDGADWQRAAWASVALLNIPLLLYYNTGWDQFGYRFSLDYMVFAISLLAAAAGERLSRALALLIAASILVNLRGVVWWFKG